MPSFVIPSLLPRSTPRLVRLYIRQCLIGFGISAAFVAGLLWLDVAGLGHLVAASEAGWVAVLMLFVFNGLVFAGVQFAMSIMRMQERDEPRGGPPRPVLLAESVPVETAARPEPARAGRLPV